MFKIQQYCLGDNGSHDNSISVIDKTDFNMVKLTTKYLIRHITSKKQFLVRKKNESDKQFLNRITHLYLQNQFIDQIGLVTYCQSVAVIYLQNNLLRTLHNIESFPNLTHLYLQRNLLTKIEYLTSLQQLQKIYLGFNEILVFEQLGDLKNLREVHIECQDLPTGETLLFEPQTVRSLQSVLCMLNISQNNLTSLSGLKGLLRLEVLIADENLISDLSDLINTIKEWPFLKKLSLIENPVKEERWYRDSVIFASKSLEVLDGKIIHEVNRKFVEKLIQHRNYLKTRKNEENRDTSTEDYRKESKIVTFRDNSGTAEDVITPFQGTAREHLTSGWQLRTNINPVNPKTFLPRPYWKKGGMNMKSKPLQLYPRN